METSWTKKTTLWSSVFILATLSFWIYIEPKFELCSWGGVEHFGCFDLSKQIILLLGPIMFVIFLLSLITYRMPEEVFRAWWNFARWMIPVIVLATLFVNNMPSNGGFFNMDALVYLIVIAPLYALLILVSIWNIARTHIKLRKKA